ncbi:MAG: lysine--tRNA ligase [Fervidicoccaceae archaeon]
MRRSHHWTEELVAAVEERIGKLGLSHVVVNGGLSVSGLQHIGRLRGEVLVGEAVRRELRRRGYSVEQKIVLYTQDPWKGKPPQLAQFPRGEGSKYVGWPLSRVPDPCGCHEGWVQHFWEDFGAYLSRFSDGEIEVVTTTELYAGPLKALVLESLEKRSKLRAVLNKYRGRAPLPEDWSPFEPICGACGRIDSTRVLSVSGELVEYSCGACGYVGRTGVENGKLGWRIEWAAVWKALRIDFEPYGRDHATPGGSRDSCSEISRLVFDYEPPAGIPYEWVSYKRGGAEEDMSSSEFVGLTPKQWDEVAHPEVLRYLYYGTHPRRRIVIDLERMPAYYEDFYSAERLYYALGEGKVSALSPDDELKVSSYELSMLPKPPSEMLPQVSYLTMALLVQSLPSYWTPEQVVERLRASGLLAGDLSDEGLRRVLGLARRAEAWVKLYAPSHVRYKLLEELPPSLTEKLRYRGLLVELGRRLEALSEWRSEAIKRVMIEVTAHLSDEERARFYEEFYMVFVGDVKGPRAAPLVEALGRDVVCKRLTRELSGKD